MPPNLPPDVTAMATPDVAALVCSARGCRAAATWGLRWNNPKLHTTARRKTWLACTDHREPLSSFLTQRGFLREVVPIAELVAELVPEVGDG